MSRTAMKTAVLAVMAAGSLAACTGVVPVRQVTDDKFGYLRKTFAASEVSKDLIKTITSQDPGSLPFRRISLSLTPTIEVGQTSSTPPAYHSTLTFLNAGGPFVQALEEQSSNSLPITQSYSLSYRNIVDLRSQFLDLAKANTGAVMEMKSLETFTKADRDAASSGLHYRYKWAAMVQMMNFPNASETDCTVGQVYPASKLNSKLPGDAQELVCEFHNSNGAKTGVSVRALLSAYGISVPVSHQTARFTTSFRIDDVQVE